MNNARPARRTGGRPGRPRSILNVTWPVWALVLALLAAAALGAGAGAALVRRRSNATSPPAQAPRPTLPEQIIGALHHGVVVVDRDERVVTVNSAAELMGVTAGDRLAVAELANLVRTATDTEQATQRDFDLTGGRAGRGPGALSAAAVPLIEVAAGGRPRVVAVVLLLEDITEQHRLEAVRRDFVANVSHELKTPVGALTLLAEAVQEAADDPDAVQRFAGRMQHEGARLGRLVRELIELSRLQGAEPLPGGAPVPVLGILEEAADRTRLAADRAGISVRVSCPSDLVVGGKENQLAMAVANLIDNAVAYSAPDTRVAVSARCIDEDGQQLVEIAVSDQGIGISESDIARVFERFYRVDPARSRETGGTGLGLAIVKHVATNHGGSVSVWSSEGAGSTFTIRLPRVNPAKGSSDSELLMSQQRGTA
jgi:two-component system, OmpR family, sensor histidine kinase SenX3